MDRKYNYSFECIDCKCRDMDSKRFYAVSITESNYECFRCKDCHILYNKHRIAMDRLLEERSIKLKTIQMIHEAERVNKIDWSLDKVKIE